METSQSPASFDLYPNSTSSAFVKAIKPTLLDPSLEYKIGLANILYPRNIYARIRNDAKRNAMQGFVTGLAKVTLEAQPSRKSFNW